MYTKNEAYQQIEDLTIRFGEQISSYKNTSYNETLVRRDFIDPFFKALGWDVDNSQGYAEAYREVIHEDKIKVGSATKAPDYSFRLPGGKRLFFVEAKKPSVAVKTDMVPAYQVRRYAWSAKLPISLLTDFEEFAVYDCNKKPKPEDKASIGRIKYLTYKDYLTEFDFLWNAFSKERVLKGSFDKFIAGDGARRGTTTVDKDFLQSLDGWRIQLAQNIALRNEAFTEDELNFTVQQTLDRIIFLRIAEDRGVEEYGRMKTALKGENFYTSLFTYFKDADDKYNSGLFDFKKDKLSRNLVIDNKVLKTIITDLYYPVSPYEFSVLSVEILGSAYEQFLGKQIRLSDRHKAVIEEKPEVRKAGGVYYTPQYIVDYIVGQTVGKLTEGKNPEQVAKLTIVDPACGSGSFLIGAYQFLLHWHLAYYKPAFTSLSETAADTTLPTKAREAAVKQRSRLPLTPDGNLTTALKKKILTNNIFGVDIDTQAVEVTKLSLLLKCMEGETGSSMTAEISFGERVLPSLDNNIKSGNSLIDLDFYDGEFDFEPGTERSIKPFSWQQSFPQVFAPPQRNTTPSLRGTKQSPLPISDATETIIPQSSAPSLRAPKQSVDSTTNSPTNSNVALGFDAVIGNPPYVRQEMLGASKPYFAKKYKVYHGMADLYSYFFERGINLLKPSGYFGIIVANKWMRANYGEPLRKWMKEQQLHSIIDFGDLPVFQSATTYPCIILASPKSAKPSGFFVTDVKTLSFDSLTNYVDSNQQPATIPSLQDSGWNLGSEAKQQLLKKLQQNSIPLGEYVKGKIFYGIKTGLNEAFVIDETTKQQLLQDKRNEEIIKPFLAGRDIKRYQKPVTNNYLILFPKGFTNKRGNYPKNAWNWLEENYTAIANYLKPFQEKAEQRYDKGDYWWELRACEYYSEFEKGKIIVPAIVKSASYAYDTNSIYSNDKTTIIGVNDFYLLGVINSKACDYFLQSIASTKQGGYYEYKPMYISKLPIPRCSEETKIVIQKLVEDMLTLNQQKQQTTLPEKLEQIHYRINYVDDKINKLIYELYKLNEEEIKIIAN